MRSNILLLCVLASLGAAGCVSSPDDELLTDDELAVADDELLTADDQALLDDALAPDVQAVSAAAAVPATPSLSHELIGCQGIVADYLIMWSAAGATRYDVDYRRGTGAYHSLYDGAGQVTHFRTSSISSVTIRARACNAGGCSAFRSQTFTPRQCDGGGNL